MDKIFIFRSYFLIFLQGISIVRYGPFQGTSHKELIDFFDS